MNILVKRVLTTVELGNFFPIPYETSHTAYIIL